MYVAFISLKFINSKRKRFGRFHSVLLTNITAFYVSDLSTDIRYEYAYFSIENVVVHPLSSITLFYLTELDSYMQQ